MSRKTACLTICLLLASTTAVAEQTTVQVVPFAGFRMGGALEDSETGVSRDIEESGSFGLALELRYGQENRWWQLWYSRQDTEIKTADGALDLGVEYLHLGGTAPINDEGRVQTYVSGGIGATRFSPKGTGLDDAVKFSGSLGLGLLVPVSERVAFRFEARGYLTLTDSDTAIFCTSDIGGSACRIVASGSTIFQAELSAGVVFGF
ncbi:MAG: porin family protein [Gammaproteobacteria bacterium]|nr:porin family protein [Gammaproteobacteria bacterium]